MKTYPQACAITFGQFVGFPFRREWSGSVVCHSLLGQHVVLEEGGTLTASMRALQTQKPPHPLPTAAAEAAWRSRKEAVGRLITTCFAHDSWLLSWPQTVFVVHTAD